MSGIIGNLPVQLQNGTTGDASQVMADLNYIVNQVNANGLSPAGLQKASGIFSVDTGTVNAYNGAYTPAITSYVQGMTLLFIPANTNTATNPTFGAGAAAYPIFKGNGQAVDIGDIQAGMVCILQYSPTINADSPGWILLNPALAWIQEVSGLALKSPTLSSPTENGSTLNSPTLNNATINTATIGGGRLNSPTINGGSWTDLPSGTRMLFQQAAVPTGWTQDTTVQNDSLLRMVNTAGGGVYAGSGVSTILRGGASADDTTLSTTQIPAHDHAYDYQHQHEGTMGPYGSGYYTVEAFGTGAATSTSTHELTVGSPDTYSVTPYLTSGIYNGSTNDGTTTSTGGGAAHAHTLSTLNINSIDIIVGVKN